jgi:transcriptional regulator GlxA family with amidase domain
MGPTQWMLHQRIERARELLETTTLPMDQIAHRCGLGSSESLRQHFTSRIGITPRDYRAMFARSPNLVTHCQVDVRGAVNNLFARNT